MNQIQDMKKLLPSLTEGGDILFVVPPFGSISDIALGTHILRSLAGENGYKADILYLNIVLASIIGVELYEKIYFAPEFRMLGERLFARGAYGLPPLGKNPGDCADEAMAISGNKNHVKMYYEANLDFDLDLYLQTEQVCKSFVDEAMAVIAAMEYKMVGCTASMTRQTNCSIALLSGVKKLSPGTVTLLGGGDCKKEMAEGMASLSTAVDYIFQGESEPAFVDFLKAYTHQKLPSQRIITGEPPGDLDRLPLPDREIFYNQYAHLLGEKAAVKIKSWYETSRGCQWAQKSKCRFCSEHHMAYRQKSINKVLRDLKDFAQSYPGKMLFMTDILMPPSYPRELPPVIDKGENFPALAYQVRIDLDLKELLNLKKAKINAVLPGIETFSTHLLELMNKGTTGSQSLLFLRNTACAGIYTDWFLLWGFPGDKVSDYEEVLGILPLIRHLQPPRSFYPMTLMRFSSYISHGQDYKIDNIRPWEAFKMIYPGWADIDKLAVYYTGDYPCESRENPGIIREIAGEVVSWRDAWKNSRLAMNKLLGSYVIHDNRGLFKQKKTHVLDARPAKEIMTAGAYEDSEVRQWALAEKLGIVLDSRYVPLVTAPPVLLSEMEEK